ncbi:unnamed protein product [Ixodes persulcatus]
MASQTRSSTVSMDVSFGRVGGFKGATLTRLKLT